MSAPGDGTAALAVRPIAPTAVEIEEAVVAVSLFSAEAAVHVRERTDIGMYTGERAELLGLVWSQLDTLPGNLHGVIDEIRRRGRADTLEPLALRLWGADPLPSRVDDHVQRLAEHHQLRRLAEVGQSIVSSAVRPGSRSPLAISETAQQQLEAIAADGPRLPALRRLLLDVKDSPPEALIPGLLVKGVPGGFYGGDGSLKTTTALALAVAYAGGYAAFGRFDTRGGGPVLVITEEDDAGTLRNRAEALIRGHGWDRSRVHSRLAVIDQQGIDLADPSCVRRVLSEVESHGARLVILDPLRDLFRGSENASDETKPVTDALRAISKISTPLVIAHSGHSGDRIRGSSQLRDPLRQLVRVVQRPEGVVTLSWDKSSRGTRPGPYTLDLTVECDPTNDLSWRSATLLDSENRTPVPEVEAVLQCLELVRDHPGLGTNDLKAICGMRRQDFSDGMREARRRGWIVEDRGVGRHGKTVRDLTDEGRARLLISGGSQHAPGGSGGSGHPHQSQQVPSMPQHAPGGSEQVPTNSGHPAVGGGSGGSIREPAGNSRHQHEQDRRAVGVDPDDGSPPADVDLTVLSGSDEAAE